MSCAEQIGEKDYFERQSNILGLNQEAIRRLSCVVLGCGGVGQNVALLLARLGVKALYLVDFDIVEISNLPRQTLVGEKDIGKMKCSSLKSNLDLHSFADTIVEIFEVDARRDWNTIKKITSRRNVVFNCIDQGQMFDASVGALCKLFGIPMIQGSSYSWTSISEIFSGRSWEKCFWCDDDKFLSEYGLNSVQDLYGDFELYLRKNSISSSNISQQELVIYLKEECSLFLLGGYHFSSIFDASMASFGTVLQLSEFCAFMDIFRKISLEKILPSNVFYLKDILFLPFRRNIATGKVGSWICPAMMTANLMVISLAKYIKDSFSSFSNLSYMDLSSFSLDSWNASPISADADDGENSIPKKPYNSSCSCCCDIQKFHERLLFYSSNMIFDPDALLSCCAVDGEYVVVNSPRQIRSRCSIISNFLTDSNHYWRQTSNDCGDFHNWSFLVEAVPCCPKELFVPFSDQRQESLAFSCSENEIQSTFRQPLMTCKSNASDLFLDGLMFSSGQRSALFYCPSMQGFLRWKGCGMTSGGVHVIDLQQKYNKNMSSVKIDIDSSSDNNITDNSINNSINNSNHIEWKQLRGCQYEFTSLQEIHQCFVLWNLGCSSCDHVGGRVSNCCGNFPLGYWRYDLNSLDTKYGLLVEEKQHDSDCSQGVENQPQNHAEEDDNRTQECGSGSGSGSGSGGSSGGGDKNPSCSLWMTCGERRLGDDVLYGLEILLDLIYSNFSSAFSTSSWSHDSNFSTSYKEWWNSIDFDRRHDLCKKDLQSATHRIDVDSQDWNDCWDNLWDVRNTFGRVFELFNDCCDSQDPTSLSRTTYSTAERSSLDLMVESFTHCENNQQADHPSCLSNLDEENDKRSAIKEPPVFSMPSLSSFFCHFPDIEKHCHHLFFQDDSCDKYPVTWNMKFPSALNPHFQWMWVEKWEKLMKGMKKMKELKKNTSFGSLFSDLYWRFGYEAGTFLRKMHEANVMWGTFQDEMGMHCNAHINNFLLRCPEWLLQPSNHDEIAHGSGDVRDESSGRQSFLAPIDFDLSYSMEEALPILGGYDQWVMYRNMEIREFGMSLCGSEHSTGVKPMVRLDNEEVRFIRLALRDTLLRGYFCGLEDGDCRKGKDYGKNDFDMWSKEWEDMAYQLLTLALMMKSKGND